MDRLPPISPRARLACEALAVLLKTARIERKMSQHELAQRLGVSRYTVMAVERGDPAVSIGTYVESAAILGVPLMADTPRELETGVQTARTILRLMPSRVRTPVKIDDDF